jgi:hypothetical protein
VSSDRVDRDEHARGDLVGREQLAEVTEHLQLLGRQRLAHAAGRQLSSLVAERGLSPPVGVAVGVSVGAVEPAAMPTPVQVVGQQVPDRSRGVVERAAHGLGGGQPQGTVERDPGAVELPAT